MAPTRKMGLVFIILSALKTWMAFYGFGFMGNAVFPLLSIMHKVVILSGLITAWYGCDKMVSFFMNKAWFVWLSAFSFIIYALHVPMVAYGIDNALQLFQPWQAFRMLTFIVWPSFLILGCIITGALLRKLLPKFYGILTGGRGF